MEIGPEVSGRPARSPPIPGPHRRADQETVSINKGVRIQRDLDGDALKELTFGLRLNFTNDISAPSLRRRITGIGKFWRPKFRLPMSPFSGHEAARSFRCGNYHKSFCA